MSNKKIDALPLAGALTGTEPTVIVQGGVTVQTTTQDIADLGGGGGGSQDLQDVTDNGNVTTNPILFDDGLGNQTVEVGADQINVLDSTLALNLFNVDRSTDTVQILGEDVATLNDIPSLTGYEQTANKSSSYTASSTTTYANTKALVDGLDSRLFTVSFECGVFSPADGAILYMSDVRISPTNLPSSVAFNLGYAYKIIGAKIGVGNNSTIGSTEDVVGKIYHLGTASSTLVGNFKTNGSAGAIASATITGLNISVAASDEIAFRMEFPTYATNPVGCFIFVTLICKTA
jgi:hypothetical protein